MNDPIQRVDCGHGGASLTIDDALARMTEGLTPVQGGERVAVRNALGRILSADVHSPVDVPGHTNSAMDGYALAGNALPAEGRQRFTVVGTAWAGRPFEQPVAPDQCVRIMTGAPLPPGTDTVVMQEQVELDGEHAAIGSGHRAGDNVRHAGEDVAAGGCVLRRGTRLRPAELGVLASMGLGEVAVHRRVRVAFFSTGDELRSVGEPLEPGCIYDSNRYTLQGALQRLGAELLDMGSVPDEQDALRRTLADAAEMADVVITSGGVSVGEADYVRDTLAALGRVAFWRVAIKPGQPLAFGHVGRALFFGLPGNPVSVTVTFYQLVQPVLRQLMGEAEVVPPRFKVRCATALKKKPGRQEFQRGILVRSSDGSLEAHRAGAQGSGILSSMARANCFIILPLEVDGVAAGEWVEVQPFEGIL